MVIARIKYAKGDEIKYVSHSDFQRCVHRLLNRSGLPIAFSQGFNPHPKVSFAMASPVGMTSRGEYLDVELKEEICREEILERLNCHAPKGLDIIDVRLYNHPLKSLTSMINSASYTAHVPIYDRVSREEVELAIYDVLKEQRIEVNKKNKKGKLKSVDIRPLIEVLKCESVEGSWAILSMNLKAGSTENLNPKVLLEHMKSRCGIFKEHPPTRVHKIDVYKANGRSLLD